MPTLATVRVLVFREAQLKVQQHCPTVATERHHLGQLQRDARPCGVVVDTHAEPVAYGLTMGAAVGPPLVSPGPLDLA